MYGVIPKEINSMQIISRIFWNMMCGLFLCNIIIIYMISSLVIINGTRKLMPSPVHPVVVTIVNITLTTTR